MSAASLVWMMPTLGALFAWGIAQGLVKKYIGEVPPARFCLYYALANAVVNTAYWLFSDSPPLFADDHRSFMVYGVLAYVLDGIAWIFYYQSIVHGPISIVGTLSAAYPALTVLFARIFLHEVQTVPKYVGVTAVLVGCLGLAYTPPELASGKTRTRWIPFAAIALLIWGANGALIKWTYHFPGASDANMALFIAVGGMSTLGVYGLVFGRGGATAELGRSLFPMATMALGSLMVAIALGKGGDASIVTPLSGAYPVVTLGFAWIILKERPTRLHWVGIVLILTGFVLTAVEF